MQHFSPSGNVAFTQPFGACEHVNHNSRREYEAQGDMPVQQIQPGEVPLTSSGPPDARDKRQSNKQQRQNAKGGAAIPAPGMD